MPSTVAAAGPAPRRPAAPRPFLKWAGGKTRLVPHLTSAFPRRYGTYFEPFLGAGAVFLALRPRRAVLADINPDLIGCWEIVRDRPEDLMRRLDGHVHDADAYYRVRDLDPGSLDPVGRAARLVYLNKTCFNGLYRVNRAGRFNVPFGRRARAPRLYDRANLLAVSAALRGASLRCAPFETVLAEARAGDFVYCDPPYQPLSSTASFTAYAAGLFLAADQVRLAAEVRRLHERGCHVAVSNSDTAEVRALYRGFDQRTLLAARAINSRGDRRGPVRELLVFNQRA